MNMQQLMFNASFVKNVKIQCHWHWTSTCPQVLWIFCVSVEKGLCEYKWIILYFIFENNLLMSLRRMFNKINKKKRNKCSEVPGWVIMLTEIMDRTPHNRASTIILIQFEQKVDILHMSHVTLVRWEWRCDMTHDRMCV